MNFWWMFDNHTFRNLGTDLNAALIEARGCWQLDPWGCLFARDGNESPVPSVHGHGYEEHDEFLTQLERFREAVTNLSTYQI